MALAASHVNRAGKISAVLWDAILVTDDGFGACMCKNCAKSHRFGLGLGRGWGGGGVGEPRTGIIYMNTWRHGDIGMYMCIYIYTQIDRPIDR